MFTAPAKQAVKSEPVVIDFNGIVLNCKGTCKKAGADGSPRNWYTVLYKGQEIQVGGRKLRGYTSISNKNNIVITAQDDSRQTNSAPVEFNSVLATL